MEPVYHFSQKVTKLLKLRLQSMDIGTAALGLEGLQFVPFLVTKPLSTSKRKVHRW